METAKKNLKQLSLIVLILTGISLVKLIVQFATNSLTVSIVPDGMSKEMLKIATIVAGVVSGLLLLPEFYIGYKGLKIAGEPTKTKGHITCAKVFLVLSVIAAISGLLSIFNSANLLLDILALVISICDVAIYYLYVKAATAVFNAAE